MTKLGRTREIAFTPRLLMIPALVMMGLWAVVYFLFSNPQTFVVAGTATIGVLAAMLSLKLLASISNDVLIVGEKENLPRGTMFLTSILLAAIAAVFSVPFLIVRAPQ